jgi:ligand-binding SRPBCC domain-containing protein
MPRIEIETDIAAPIELIFDLSRSIDAHKQSQSTHNEVAVAGRTSGLIEVGEQVTWRATHFGIRQHLTSRIEIMERPRHFRDSMVRGAFKKIDHDHYFEAKSPNRTIMRDVFEYEAPFGFVGRVADRLFLERYMRKLLGHRNQVIKELAESAAASDS